MKSFKAHDFCRALALILFLAFSSLAHGQSDDEVHITLLLVSDIYDMDSDKERGSFSRAAAVARSEKFFNDNVLYIHAGDTLSPSLLSSIDQGAHVVDLLNVYPPDVFVPGNHEFDFGPEVFRQRILLEMRSEIFGANIRDAHGNRLQGITDAKTYDFDGVVVGVFGMISPDVRYSSSPGDGYRFLPLLETAKKTADALRDAGAHIVVAVSHSNFSEDELLVEDGAVDVLLSGDDHDLRLEYNGEVAFAETREEGDYLVALDLVVDTSDLVEDNEVDWWPNWRVIDTRDYDPDPETERLAQTYMARLSEEFDRDIGSSSTPLDTRRASVRTKETAFGNMVADVMRISQDADIGFMNGGGIRGNKEYPANQILTMRDIFSEMPFGNTIVKLSMKGSVLRDALENGVSRVEDVAGRFLQVSGISMSVDLGKPSGERVTNVLVGGEPLDLEAQYTVATNDYVAGGGDGFLMFATDADILVAAKDTSLVAQQVVDHIRDRGSISPAVEGRIKM